MNIIKVEKIIDENDEIILSTNFGSIIAYGISQEEAINMLLADIKIYVEDYCNNLESMSKSKNRAEDLPVVLKLKDCKQDNEIRDLLEIKISI